MESDTPGWRVCLGVEVAGSLWGEVGGSLWAEVAGSLLDAGALWA